MSHNQIEEYINLIVDNKNIENQQHIIILFNMRFITIASSNNSTPA